MKIFAFVALLAIRKLKFQDYAERNNKNMISWRTSFDTSVVLKYSSEKIYISEKIAYNLENVFWKDYHGTAG